MKRLWIWFLPLLLMASQALANSVWIVPVKGAIGPATSDYLSREIEEAQRNG
ncbi:nodulation protein NfeD, partial [Vibrio parahaemolyticus]|nr:nodulation protein NfeD [Vibrio parahaemolyticus]